jgi:hypothetical protein
LLARLYSEEHDVAVTNVQPSETIVGQGQTVKIDVTVENHGNITETFNVSAYALYQGNSSATAYFLESSSSLPTIYVDPAEISNFLPTSMFNVGVKISNVTNLYGFDLKFRWDSKLLDYVNHSVRVPKDDYPDGVLWEPIMLVKDEVNATAGTYWIACTSCPCPIFQRIRHILLYDFSCERNRGLPVNL